MVGGRFLGKDRDRRQHPGDVAGEKNDRCRFPGAVGHAAHGDVLERIAAATVFGQRGICVVGYPVFVQHHVLDDGAEADGVPDDRLVLVAEIDGLGVAAAFQVEHGAFGPAVFVVADQIAVGVGRQGGLAGPGEAEEQGDVTAFPDVGGAVHGHDVLFRQQEVLYREHALLQLAGIAHAGNQQLALREVDDHRAFAMGAVAIWVAAEAGGVEHFPLRFSRRIVARGPDEHVAGEQAVPGGFGGHLDRKVVLGILAHVQVRHESLALRQIGFDTRPERVEAICAEGAVDRAPGDIVGGARLLDDEAVGGRSAGVAAGGGQQGAAVGERAFAALEGQFDQFRAVQVGVGGDRGHFDPRRQGVLSLGHWRLVWASEGAAIMQKNRSRQQAAR